MKISWGNHIRFDNISPKNGFGYVTERVVDSLRYLGHEVEYQSADADLEFWYDQPQWLQWHNPDTYKVLYVPWESTGVYPEWIEKMNTADEVWTPSPVVAQWFVEAGVNVPVHVFQHGVDKVWSPVERVVEGQFNLFHHGGEAARKGWDLTAKAFFELGIPHSHMNFKMTMPGWKMPVPGISILDDRLDIDELVALYHEQHMMVYPSWGEGFGLTPLQAIATGMPVVITKGWAPYEYLLPPECLIDSELTPSPWEKIHPGMMWKPNYDDMLHKIKHVYENYDDFVQDFLNIGRIVTDQYDWDALTDAAFSELEARK